MGGGWGTTFCPVLAQSWHSLGRAFLQRLGTLLTSLPDSDCFWCGLRPPSRPGPWLSLLDETTQYPTWVEMFVGTLFSDTSLLREVYSDQNYLSRTFQPSNGPSRMTMLRFGRITVRKNSRQVWPKLLPKKKRDRDSEESHRFSPWPPWIWPITSRWTFIAWSTVLERDYGSPRCEWHRGDHSFRTGISVNQGESGKIKWWDYE